MIVDCQNFYFGRDLKLGRKRKYLSRKDTDVLLILTLLLFSAMSIEVGFPQNETAVLFIDPPSLITLTGNLFEVSVTVANVTDLFAWEFNLTFNPFFMQCVGVEEGSFLREAGPTNWPSPIIDNENGSIKAGCSLLTSGPGVNGTGILAYLTFRCMRPGESYLIFIETSLLDSALTEIPHETSNGIVLQEGVCIDAEQPIKPTHVHSQQGLIDLYEPPLGSEWHELYPEYCNMYTLTSWEDNGDGYLSPCDQIDMTDIETGKVEWYHVDRITITLIVTESELERAAEFIGPYDPEILYNPICTYWHEVFPEYSNVYHIIGWEDNGDGILSPCDYIEVNNTETGELFYWHVEDVATDLILTEKIASPYCTYWHELYPNYCERFHVAGWEDNGDGILSPCDKIELRDVETNKSHWYHVDNLTLTLNLSGLFLEFDGGYSHLFEPIVDPLYTYWHEVYPTYSNEYTLDEWYDNGDGILSACDTIGISGMTEEIVYYHVDEISYDLIVSPTSPPWYQKGSYVDYAPSGMPDFDQRQTGTYKWVDHGGFWSHCGPVSVANSLWWFDSKYEPNNVPPPTIGDGFPLVQSYNPGVWDDHDSRNVQPLVEHLAWLMDCDGRRTGRNTNGTLVWDMEAGIAQYLSWSGVNPLGDVNGDGVVNQTDIDIVNAAMGSTPGDPNWNLAADIYPATVTYPPATDNVVNMDDLNLVTANLGKIGMFYEHTTDLYPDFFHLEREIERSQDVIILLGFYYFNGTTWIRDGGHFVTVAGVNSTTQELLISNPIRDDFEAGQTSGCSPIPHLYPHNSMVHNDASLVSHDAYKVFFNGAGGYWAFEGYFDDPTWEARIEYAVITSPLDIHDIAVTNVIPVKSVVGQDSTCKINVTVTNEGNFAETFNLTLYANTTAIYTHTNIVLTSGNSTTITFIWNTTSWSKGNYTLWAYAWPVPEEEDTTDNIYTDNFVIITIMGDVDGNFEVDIFDITYICVVYDTRMGEPEYVPNCDINSDGIIDIFDVTTACITYGQKDP